MQKNLFFLSIMLLAMVSCAQPQSEEVSHVYILSTNDMHANIEAMPRLATLVKEYETRVTELRATPTWMMMPSLVCP